MAENLIIRHSIVSLEHGDVSLFLTHLLCLDGTATIASLREKYDVHSTVERYTSADMPETDNHFIRK